MSCLLTQKLSVCTFTLRGAALVFLQTKTVGAFDSNQITDPDSLCDEEQNSKSKTRRLIAELILHVTVSGLATFANFYRTLEFLLALNFKEFR